MPRYYFHLNDGLEIVDDEGFDLSSLAEARIHAAQFLGAALVDAGSHIFAREIWTADVTDETGRVLCTVEVRARNIMVEG